MVATVIGRKSLGDTAEADLGTSVVIPVVKADGGTLHHSHRFICAAKLCLIHVVLLLLKHHQMTIDCLSF